MFMWYILMDDDCVIPNPTKLNDRNLKMLMTFDYLGRSYYLWNDMTNPHFTSIIIIISQVLRSTKRDEVASSK